MTAKELRHHDIIKPAQRIKPTRNLTNDLANGAILLFIVIMLFTVVQAF